VGDENPCGSLSRGGRSASEETQPAHFWTVDADVVVALEPAWKKAQYASAHHQAEIAGSALGDSWSPQKKFKSKNNVEKAAGVAVARPRTLTSRRAGRLDTSVGPVSGFPWRDERGAAGCSKTSSSTDCLDMGTTRKQTGSPALTSRLSAIFSISGHI